MPVLTKEQAKALLTKALSYSKAEQCEINLSGSDSGNVRYARNSVSTSGGISTNSLVVSSAFGKKLGVATINEFDDASLEKVVRRSEELAQLAPENPEFMPFLGPQQYGPDSPTFSEATAAMSAKERADAVQASLTQAKENKLTAAGFLSNSTGFSAMLNSKGLFAYYKATDVAFNITVRTEDGKGSGYATKGYNDFKKLNTKADTATACKKALASVTAKAIEPGKYTVILEPTAVAVMLENLFFDMDARQADEGRSSMSKPGGKTKVGEQLLDERVNIYSDPWNPELPTSVWSGDGRPQQKVNWIEKGVVKNLYSSRYWAQKTGIKAIPAPDGAIMLGGTKSLEELIKGTEKGILVTRLWYIRPVDPQTLLLTGLTRDGTFYIENGEIKFPVKNFRFNESPIIMLNNLEEMGKSERTVSAESNVNYLLPPLKIRDFTFTSLSDAV
ncbi:TldD/PmbA family protein [Pedobacter insulae]|uniref:Predicted Zn-dependent protease or its inactivated homolog n=1 Tax=Pedobacter insulae TaxID=414048 RepID=A0A1I2ZFU9_9SPHI|nr:TldD/PmbA family protein [Pedobacter insulae]SFH35991.1 Predicted Zn-dependent protease or its inactivated homolog [Pedobacter insulae]